MNDFLRLSPLLPVTLVTLTKIGGGRNSRVFKAVVHTGQTYLIKEYFQSADDPRDRLHTEWTALTFLREHGISCVPRPLMRHDRERVAVYEYIVGSPATLQADAKTLPQLSDFWEALYALRDQGGQASLPAASEACFSLHAIATQLDARIKRLLHASPTTTMHDEMRAFVRQALLPQISASLQNAENGLRKMGLTPVSLLRDDLRMPSPSDFGLHNALQTDDGRLFFVDFEYFGMDDPVKLLADTCLHPAMVLTAEQKAWLVARMYQIAATGKDTLFGTRFALLSPLWRYKWCCIVLNSFVPCDDARRAFAQGTGTDADLLQRQLAKAQRLVEEHHEYERIFLPHA